MNVSQALCDGTLCHVTCDLVELYTDSLFLHKTAVSVIEELRSGHVIQSTGSGADKVKMYHLTYSYRLAIQIRNGYSWGRLC